jgi:threonine dehydrogenase-like Zn-dependent dehydrogenase
LIQTRSPHFFGENTMRALVCHAPQDLRLETATLDKMGSHQLQVRVAFGGICGSDLHYFQHGGFGTVRLKEPMALGHEVSGVIDAVGGAVTGYRVGQRIAISPSRPCGACSFCQQGLPNHCSDMRFYGSAMRFPHVQGAFQEMLIIDASQAHPIADSLSLSEAALAEPLVRGLARHHKGRVSFWQASAGHGLWSYRRLADCRITPRWCDPHRSRRHCRFAPCMCVENGCG